MATQFEKVFLGNIEQGEFVKNAEAAFQEIASAAIEHFRQYAKDCEAGLDLKIKLSQKDGAFTIVTDINKKLPKKPASVTTAMAELDPEEDGKFCLFTQKGGTHRGNPRQLTICKDNGSDLDNE